MDGWRNLIKHRGNQVCNSLQRKRFDKYFIVLNLQ